MKHSSARNTIERCFGLLKLCWTILRSSSFYPIKIHNQIITACCLLHNYIRRAMLVDPLEEELDQQEHSYTENNNDPIIHIEASDKWSALRRTMTNNMFNAWRGIKQSN
jgi:hypothetical protein